MSKVVRSIALIFALVLSFGVTSALGPDAASADPPVCQVFCVTSECSAHSDCTAAPNGRCDFACPGVGCCVYN